MPDLRVISIMEEDQVIIKWQIIQKVIIKKEAGKFSSLLILNLLKYYFTSSKSTSVTSSFPGFVFPLPDGCSEPGCEADGPAP
jgi:hypothetical protein